jgi:hypothetical protein
VKPLSKKYLLKCLFKIKQTNLQEVWVQDLYKWKFTKHGKFHCKM